jgi:hypothetical protein
MRISEYYVSWSRTTTLEGLEIVGDIDFNSPASAALASQNQADMYKRYLEMQEQLKKNPDALNFMPMMPFQTQSTNPELVSNAWANAGKTLATSALSGVGKMYGM